MPRPFPFLHEIGTLDGRKPDIENECDGSAGRFEDAAHRYDCLMRSRKDTDRLKTEMEELFADLCQVPRLVASRRGFRPAVDVYRAESPSQVTVVVELAGVDPADTEVSMAEGVLLIRGIRRRSTQDRILHMEVDYGPFEREVAILEAVDPEAAEATYVRGLLVITLPIVQRAPRKLTVQITARGSS
jgi:HSP20 family protein